jgi:hypothetical protein
MGMGGAAKETEVVGSAMIQSCPIAANIAKLPELLKKP